MNEITYYDNSMIRDYRANGDRYFFYKYVKNWVPNTFSIHLAAGTAWHSGQDVLWDMIKNQPHSTDEEIAHAASQTYLTSYLESGAPENWNDPEVWLKLKPKTPDVAAKMFRGYLKLHRKWIENVDILGVEKPFAVKLWPDREIYYVGVIDKLIEYELGIAPLDHKTTGAFSVESGIQFKVVNEYRTDAQLKGYCYGMTIELNKPITRSFVDLSLYHRNKLESSSRFDVHKRLPHSYDIEIINQWLLDTRSLVERIEEEKFKYLADQYAFPRGCKGCSTYRECLYADLCCSGVGLKALSKPENLIESKWIPVGLRELMANKEK